MRTSCEVITCCLVVSLAVVAPSCGGKQPSLDVCEKACQRQTDLRVASVRLAGDALGYVEEDDDSYDELESDEIESDELEPDEDHGWEEDEDHDTDVEPSPRMELEMIEAERRTIEDRRRDLVAFSTMACVQQCRGGGWSRSLARCRADAGDLDAWHRCR